MSNPTVTKEQREWLRPIDVEREYPITRALLARMRYEGKGPRYYRPTPKTILYKPAEIEAWIESSQRQGTAELSR